MNIKNRTIYCKDNLDILVHIDSESIDCIYLDPPFNKNKSFTAPIGSTASGASFKDIFTKEDYKEEWKEEFKIRTTNFIEIEKAIHKHYGADYEWVNASLDELVDVIKSKVDEYNGLDNLTNQKMNGE